MISDIDICARLLTAAALGCMIGFERERLLWAAGIRTHMLVAVGAALLIVVSAYGFQHATEMPHVVLDPSRIAAQVVSGIGFLGAGTILLRGRTVRGLTTAASIWAVAAVGLAAGAGLYFAALLSTGIMLLILAGLKPLEEAYRRRIKACTFEVVAEAGLVTVDTARALLGLRSVQLARLIIHDEGEVQTVRIHLTRVSEHDINAGLAHLRQAPGVLSAEVRRKRAKPAPNEG